MTEDDPIDWPKERAKLAEELKRRALFAIPVQIVSKTRRFLACPSCKHDEAFPIDHLDQLRSFGPWYCDGCGHAICGEVIGGQVVLSPVPETVGQKKTPAVAVLRVRGTKILLVLDTFSMDRGENEEERQDHSRYFYEEHTCPTNVVRDIAVIIDGDDEDPHGVFEFVAKVDVTREESERLRRQDEMPAAVRAIVDREKISEPNTSTPGADE